MLLPIYCSIFFLLTSVNLLLTELADGLQSDSCSTVHLIHVVPSSDNEELSGWNKTELYVLQSAKQLALSYINSRSDLLPGIKLEIVDVSTDDCARDSSMQDFVETFKLIVSKHKCILGIIGLYCSRVTNIVSSILSHDNFGYIQLSAATSPLLRNRNRFPLPLLEEILVDTGLCTKEEVLKASDHVIFLLNKLNNSLESSQSEINSENYKRDRNISGLKVHGMEDFANVLYDQIWAMSFALNNSLYKAVLHKFSNVIPRPQKEFS